MKNKTGNLEAHVKTLRKSQKSAEDLLYDNWVLCIMVQQLADMGHGTSIVAQLLDMSHGSLVSKLRAIKKGRLGSIEPATAEQIEKHICLLSTLPQTAAAGRELLRETLGAYGHGGVNTLSSLAEYLGVSRAIVSRWQSEPPSKIKIDLLLALTRLKQRLPSER